jgi:hypothetical protein
MEDPDTAATMDLALNSDFDSALLDSIVTTSNAAIGGQPHRSLNDAREKGPNDGSELLSLDDHRRKNSMDGSFDRLTSLDYDMEDLLMVDEGSVRRGSLSNTSEEQPPSALRNGLIHQSGPAIPAAATRLHPLGIPSWADCPRPYHPQQDSDTMCQSISHAGGANSNFSVATESAHAQPAEALQQSNLLGVMDPSTWFSLNLLNDMSGRDYGFPSNQGTLSMGDLNSIALQHLTSASSVQPHQPQAGSSSDNSFSTNETRHRPVNEQGHAETQPTNGVQIVTAPNTTSESSSGASSSRCGSNSTGSSRSDHQNQPPSGASDHGSERQRPPHLSSTGRRQADENEPSAGLKSSTQLQKKPTNGRRAKRAAAKAAVGQGEGGLSASTASTELPPFRLFDAPVELRHNFIQAQRSQGLPVMYDDNSRHYGMAINGFHPSQCLPMTASATMSATTPSMHNPSISALASSMQGASTFLPPSWPFPTASNMDETKLFPNNLSMPLDPRISASSSTVRLIDGRHGVRNRSKNAKEQKRAHRITELIDGLHEQMENDGWNIALKSKFNTLTS